MWSSTALSFCRVRAVVTVALALTQYVSFAVAAAPLSCDTDPATDGRCVWWDGRSAIPASACVYMNTSSRKGGEVGGCGITTAFYIPAGHVDGIAFDCNVAAFVQGTVPGRMNVHTGRLDTPCTADLHVCGRVQSGADFSVAFPSQCNSTLRLDGQFDEGSMVTTQANINKVVLNPHSTYAGTVALTSTRMDSVVSLLDASALDYVSGTWLFPAFNGLGTFGAMVPPKVAWRGANISIDTSMGAPDGGWGFVLDRSTLAYGGRTHPDIMAIDASNGSNVTVRRDRSASGDSLTVTGDQSSTVSISGGPAASYLALVVLPNSQGVMCNVHCANAALGPVNVTAPTAQHIGEVRPFDAADTAHAAPVGSTISFVLCPLIQAKNLERSMTISGNLTGVKLTFQQVTFGLAPSLHVTPAYVTDVVGGTFVFDRCTFMVKVAPSFLPPVANALIVRDVRSAVLQFPAAIATIQTPEPEPDLPSFSPDDAFPVRLSNLTASSVALDGTLTVGAIGGRPHGGVLVEKSQGSKFVLFFIVLPGGVQAKPIALQHLSGLGSTVEVTMLACPATLQTSLYLGAGVDAFEAVRVHHAVASQCPISIDPSGGDMAGDELVITGTFKSIDARVKNVENFTVDNVTVSERVSVSELTNVRLADLRAIVAAEFAITKAFECGTVRVTGVQVTTTTLKRPFRVEAAHNVDEVIVEGSVISVTPPPARGDGSSLPETRGIFVGAVTHDRSPAAVTIRGCTVTAPSPAGGHHALIHVLSVTGPRAAADNTSRVLIEGNTLTSPAAPVAATGSYTGVFVGDMWGVGDVSVDPPAAWYAPKTERSALVVKNNTITIAGGGSAAPRSSGIATRAANITSVLITGNTIVVSWLNNAAPAVAVTSSGAVSIGVSVELAGNSIQVGGTVPAATSGPKVPFVDFGAETCENATVVSSRNTFAPVTGLAIGWTTFYSVPMSPSCTISTIEDTFLVPTVAAPPPLITDPSSGAVPAGSVRVRGSTIADSADPSATRAVAGADLPAGAVIVPVDECAFRDVCGALSLGLARCLDPQTVGSKDPRVLCMCRCPEGLVTNNTVLAAQCSATEPSTDRYQCIVASPTLSATRAKTSTPTATNAQSPTRSNAATPSRTPAATLTPTQLPTLSLQHNATPTASTSAPRSTTPTRTESPSVPRPASVTAQPTQTPGVALPLSTATASLMKTHSKTSALSVSTTHPASMSVTAAAATATTSLLATVSSSPALSRSPSLIPTASSSLKQATNATNATMTSIPAFYQHDGATGVLFAVTRGTGVSAQRPLRVIMTSATARPLGILQMAVAVMAPAFDNVAVNGALFSSRYAEDVQAASSNVCGALRVLETTPGAVTAGPTLRIDAGAAFVTSCDTSVYFSGVVSVSDGSAVRRSAVTRPATLRSLSSSALNIGNASAGAAHSTTSVRLATSLTPNTDVAPATLSVFGATSPSIGAFNRTADTFEVLHCSAGDIDSFHATAHYVGAGAALPCTTASGAVCSTTVEFQQACSANAACAGFTTAVTSTTGAALGATGSVFTEVPVSMHAVATPMSPDSKIASAAELALLQRRIPGRPAVVAAAFYRRLATRERTCTAPVKSQGRVRVLLQQTSLAEAAVDIFVKTTAGLEMRQGRCGGADLFESAQPGQSGACDLFLQCTEVQVGPGDVVSVVPQQGVSQFGCGESLGALLVFEPSADSTTPAAPSPFRGHDVAGFAVRPLAVRSAVVSNAAITMLSLPVLTFGALNSTLRVAQNRFACGAGAGTASCSASDVVTLSSGTARASCGGPRGFPALGAGPRGYSGQCQMQLDCSDALMAPASVSSSGLWAQRTLVSVDPTLLRSPEAVGAASATAGTCAAFSATLHLDAPPAAPGSPPLFPLWCQGAGTESGVADGSLCPVLMLPSAAAQTAAGLGVETLRAATLDALLPGRSVAVMRASASQAAVLALANVKNARNSEDAALFVDWPTVRHSVAPLSGFRAQSVALAAALRPDVTFGCMMDAAPALGTVTCSVPVPENATAAAVDFLQTDFAANEAAVAFVAADGALVEPATLCGGAHLFMGQRGGASQCDSYLTCRRGLLPNARLGADAGRPVAVRITVPQGMANGPCDWALAALVSFDSRPLPQRACDPATEFTCTADAACVPQSSVCDGVPNDCGDNSDEAQCRFTFVDRGVAAKSSIVAASLPSVTAYTECLRATVLRGGRAFFVDATTGCTVVNSTDAVALVAAPTSWTVPQVNDGRSSELHVATPLVTPLSRYGRCTAVLHCADRGVITDQETCACRCLTSFTGTNCQTLVQTGTVVEYVAVVARSVAQSSNASLIPLNVFESALAPPAMFPAVRITSVGQPLPYDEDHVGFPFTADSEDRQALAVYLSRIFAADTLAAMNAALRPSTGHSATVRFVFGVDAPNEFQPIGGCAAAANGTVSGCPMPASAQGPLLITAAGLSGISVTTQRLYDQTTPARLVGESSPMSGAQRSVASLALATNADGALRCEGSAVSFGDTSAIVRCRPRTCLLTPGPNTSVDIAQSLALVNATVDSECAVPAVSISAAQRVVQPPATEPSVALISTDATEGFVVATAVAAVAVAALLVCATVAAVVFGFALRNAATSIAGRASVRKDAWYIARESLSCSCGREPLIAGASAALVLSGLCAGFFAVLYIHSRDWGSNSAVLVELFPTAQCGGRLLKTLPTSMTTIEATGRCHALAVTGRSVGALFGAAECVADGAGSKVPRLRVSRTMAECRASVMATVTPRVCEDFAQVLPIAASPFALTSCVTADAARQRTASLAVFNPVEPMKGQVTVTHDSAAPLPTMGSRRVPVSASNGTYTAAFETGYTRTMSTSIATGTVATIARASEYTGGFAAQRLLVQDAHAFGPASATPYESVLEQQYQPNLTRLDQSTAALAGLTPSDGDYPVGFVFSGFGSSAEVSGDAAGLAAQRYRGVRGTAFDVGHQFEPQPTKARLAVTLSFWLRATTSAKGFVFAVTDDFEDTHSRLSPVMARLQKVAASGESGTVPWFAQDWHAYSALYIDGASQSLAFLFADPSDELAGIGAASGLNAAHRATEGVVRAQWDLKAMGEGSLFNGAWHKVSVALRNDEGRFFAVIAIDGRSSLSDSRWRRCLPRRPRPIVPALAQDRGGVVNVTHAHRAAVSNGGVMYVGHFNGAVRGLAVRRGFHGAAADVRKGTRAMRVHAALPYRLGIGAIAAALLIAAALTLLYVFVSAASIVQRRRAAGAATKAKSVKFFNANAAAVFTARYAPLPFGKCVSWLGVTPQALMQIHEELSASPVMHDGRVKIIAALWTARQARLRAKRAGDLTGSTATAPLDDDDDEKEREDTVPEYPTPEQWRDFLAAQKVDVVTAAATDVKALCSGRGTPNNAEANAVPQSTNDDTNAAPQSNVNVANDEGTAANPSAGENASESARSGTNSIAGLDIGGAQVSAIALAALGTLQAAGVYIGSFGSVPEVYDRNVGALLGLLTLSFDFFQTIAADPLAGAMAQALAVVVVLVAVAFVLARDDRRFYGTVLRYRTRRDTLLLAREENVDVAELTAKVQRMLAAVDPDFDPRSSVAPFSELHAVHVLPPEDRCAVSALLGTAEVGDGVGVAARDGSARVVLAEKAMCCRPVTAARTFPEDRSDALVGLVGRGSMRRSGAASSEFSEQSAGHLGTFSSFALPQAAQAAVAVSKVQTATFDPCRKPKKTLRDSASVGIVNEPVAALEEQRHPSGLHLRYIGSRSVAAVRCLKRRLRDEPSYNGIFEADEADVADTNDGEVLRTTGHACIRHRTWLSCEEYTDVYPYYNRRRCCAVTDGVPCGRDIGPMHCCTESECGYALCAEHLRFSGPKGLLMQLRSATSRFTRNGPVWFLEFIVLTLALALYTPALRTCVMILGCHPVYQCEFGDCWSYPTQRFAAAAYLAIVVLVLYGALFPLAFLALLYGRYRALRRLFARASYGGRYLEPVPADDTPALNAELQQRSAAVTVAFAVSWVSQCAVETLKRASTTIAKGQQKGESGDEGSAGEASLDGARRSFLQRWLLPSGGAAPTSAPYGDAQETSGASLTLSRDVSSQFSLPERCATGPDSVPSTECHAAVIHVAPAQGLKQLELVPPSEGQGSSGVSPAASPKSLRHHLRTLARQPSSREATPPAASPNHTGQPSTAEVAKPTVTVRAELAERLETVASREWQRFLVSDRSVMAKLYTSVPVERLGAIPILSVAKFLLLVPPLLLEPSSAMQFLFIAIGEIGFAVGFVLAEPYTSPWVTVTTLAGSLHQFLVVALQALITARANDEDLSGTVGALMTATTIAYIVFVAVVVGAVLVYGIVATKLHQALSKSFFARFSIPRPATEPVFLCPPNDVGQGPVDTYVVERMPTAEVVDAVVQNESRAPSSEVSSSMHEQSRAARVRCVVVLDEPRTASAPAPIRDTDAAHGDQQQPSVPPVSCAMTKSS